MKVLTALNSAHDAEEILHWLNSHGVKASIEGRQSYSTGIYVPNVLTICVHIDEQYQYAQKLLRQLDHGKPRTVDRRSLLTRLRVKKLDKLFVAVTTLVIALGVLGIVFSIIR
jgi:hypothetical protein